MLSVIPLGDASNDSWVATLRRAFHVAIDGSQSEVEPILLGLEVDEDGRSAMFTKQAVGPLGVGVGL